MYRDAKGKLHKGSALRYTQEELLNDLVELAKEKGRTPTLIEIGRCPHMASQKLYYDSHYFDTYAEACRKAGLIPNKKGMPADYFHDVWLPENPQYLSKELYKDLISRFGISGQCIKTMEELSELSQALSKYILEGTHEHLAEEIAHVEIMCEQLRAIFSPLEKDIERYKKEAIQRIQKVLDKEAS